jgi:hypothetical protein
MDTEAGRIEHIWILLLSAAAIVGAFVLQPGPEGSLMLPLDYIGVQLQLPETCASRLILRVSCPGCGLTRSFVSVARGEWKMATRANAMGPILFSLCCLQVPYRIIRYMGWAEQYQKHRAASAVQAVLTWGVAGGLIVTWLIPLVGI